MVVGDGDGSGSAGVLVEGDSVSSGDIRDGGDSGGTVGEGHVRLPPPPS